MNCYKFLLIALPLAMILSCSSDDDSEFEQPEKKSYPIMMTATERPLADPDAPKGAPSRAPKVTTSTLDEFKVFFYGSDIGFGSDILLLKVDSNSKLWKSDQSWPSGYADNQNVTNPLTFYAYNYFDQDEGPENKTNISSDGEAIITVDVDDDIDQQTDLLAGMNVGTFEKYGASGVPMTFDHISAAVQVTLKKTTSLEDYTVIVHDVKLHNIVCKGDYYFKERKWDLFEKGSENEWDYPVTSFNDGGLEVETSPKLLNKEGDYLFLLPQILEGWTKDKKDEKLTDSKYSYIEIKCKIFNDTEGYKVGQATEYGSVYLPLGAELKMGYINKLNISMGTALRNDKGERIF